VIGLSALAVRRFLPDARTVERETANLPVGAIGQTA
jgi:hypothetical protein